MAHLSNAVQSCALLVLAGWLSCPAVAVASDREQSLQQLERLPHVDRAISEAFREGADVVDASIAVKGRSDPGVFYRPLFDDSPEELQESYAGLLRDVPGLYSAIVRSSPAIGALRIVANPQLLERVAQHSRVHAVGLTPTGSYDQHVGIVTPIIGMSGLHGSGFRGAGKVVAIIDKKFYPTTMGSTVYDEACFSAGNLCPGGTSQAFGSGASASLFNSLPENNAHGTQVAAVIAQPNGLGTAPDVRILPVAAPDVDDVINALWWLAGRSDIDAIVFSGGLGNALGTCDNDPGIYAAWLPPLATLYEKNVETYASAGNSASAQARMMAVPACLAKVTGVSGTYKCDENFTCPLGVKTNTRFPSSQYSFATDVASPANNINTVSVAGHSGNVTGTSFSAPAVAGCAAILEQKHGELRLDELHAAFRWAAANVYVDVTPLFSGTGQQVRFPRLDCGAASTFLGSRPLVKILQHGWSGNWYRTTTGGQGLTFEMYKGIGIASGQWYTFAPDTSGAQRWFTLAHKSGTTITSTTTRAYFDILATTDGYFNGSNPGQAQTAVGTAWVEFDTCRRGRLNYNFTHPGYSAHGSGTIDIFRITENVSCLQQGIESLSNLHPEFLLSGNYYNPATSGQGVIVEVNPENRLISVNWFTFAAPSASGPSSMRWFSITGAHSPGQTSHSSLPIYAVTGGKFNILPPQPVWTQVGTASFSFSGCSAAALTFNFTHPAYSSYGSGTIALQRVGPVPAGC